MRRQVLPNVFGLVLANTTLTIAAAIFLETTLSFLGVGPRDTYSWGRILEESFAAGALTLGKWAWFVPPGRGGGAGGARVHAHRLGVRRDPRSAPARARVGDAGIGRSTGGRGGIDRRPGRPRRLDGAADDGLLEVRDLVVEFTVGDGRVARAVDGISFDVDAGEAVGLVGESGCGKTTTALAIMRLLPENGRIAAGSVLFDGEELGALEPGAIRRRRWTDISIVFQGAMNALNPVRRVGDQVAEPILLHQPTTTRQAAWTRVGELFEMVGISPERRREYPHQFSGGMRQRVMIAMALASQPRLVIGDEPTTALDVMVQAQILELLERLRAELGLAMILITHDLSVVAETCDRAVVMYAGQLAETGTVGQLHDRPLHPYTRPAPVIRAGRRGRAPAARGHPGSATQPGCARRGCRFHPRCDHAMAVCVDRRPAERSLRATPRRRLPCRHGRRPAALARRAAAAPVGAAASPGCPTRSLDLPAPEPDAAPGGGGA